MVIALLGLLSLAIILSTYVEGIINILQYTVLSVPVQ